MIEKKDFLKRLFRYVLIILGGITVGIGIGWILLPVKLSTGGFSGISIILYYIFNIPASIGIIILNIPLSIAAIKILGIKISIRSLVGMLSISLGLIITEHLTPLTEDILLAAIFGGIAIGIGVSLAIRGDGTTGGTDLVAKLINNKRPFLNLGQILLIIDGIIILASAIIFKDIDVALYSIVAVFIMSKTMDFMLEGIGYSKAMFIISNKPDEVSDYVLKEIGRGATGLQGRGMYTKENKEVILCIVNKRELPKLKNKIKEIDNKAFMIITTVTEAIGEGFRAI